jgi:hypothetical protein
MMEITRIPNEEGIYNTVYIPILVNKRDIECISPFITKTGRLYKNVSILETHGKNRTIAENYMSLRKRMSCIKVKGFRK